MNYSLCDFSLSDILKTNLMPKWLKNYHIINNQHFNQLPKLTSTTDTSVNRPREPVPAFSPCCAERDALFSILGKWPTGAPDCNLRESLSVTQVP